MIGTKTRLITHLLAQKLINLCSLANLHFLSFKKFVYKQQQLYVVENGLHEKGKLNVKNLKHFALKHLPFQRSAPSHRRTAHRRPYAAGSSSETN